MDKAHKQTDKILTTTNKTTKQTYLNSFIDIKEQFLAEYSKFDLKEDMSPQARLNEVNKYDRFNKLAEIVVAKLLETNRNAISGINKNLSNVYQMNYNAMVESLGKKGLQVEEINKTETKEEIKENESPYNQISINTATDKANLRREVSNNLLGSILKATTGLGAFLGMKQVFEKNLKSSVAIATAEATRLENTARYTALKQAEKEAEKQGEVIVKIWRTQGDDRVRDAHARAEGQEAEIDMPFYVGGEQLMFPRDINGSPGNVINCRCYIEYESRKK